MGNDENIITDRDHENDIPVSDELTTETETPSPAIEEETGNMDICPNCLEPNTENLAVCKYCGMPLHQGADPDAFVRQETEEELAANRAQAVPEQKKPQKPQENGFRRIMPWLGLYLIYYGITGFFDVSRQIKAAEAEGQPVNSTLAYASQVIWLAAGVLMAWPLIKKGYRKLGHLPEEDETTEETSETETAENSEAVDTEQADIEVPVETEESAEETAVSDDTAETITEDAAADAAEGSTPETAGSSTDAEEPQNRLTNEDGTEEENEDANWL